MSSPVVCVTAFRQGNPDNLIERVRAEVFLDSVRKLASFGIPCVALFADTQTTCLDILKRTGVVLVAQQSMGMGNIRREVIREASSLFPKAEFYCWLEPEKSDLPRFISPMVALMSKEKSGLGIFNRTSMASYPPEQAYYYLFCRTVASNLVGFDFDYAFGPMVMSKLATRFFLEYMGEYGDKWDAILVPRLRIMKHAMGTSLLPIDFENDSRMTAIESGDPNMMLKRIEQINNVVPSLIKEWDELNITF